MATLTEGERKVLRLAWQCFKAVPEVDYKKLQELGGYKTPASATSCYLAARKKFLSTSSSNTPVAKLTDGEEKVLSMAWQCFKAMPQVDYKALAQLGAYKTPASATSCYLAARKKVLHPSITTTSENAPVAAGRKRKVATTEVEAPTKAVTKRRVKNVKRDPDMLEGNDVDDVVKGEEGVDDKVTVKREEDEEMGTEHLLRTAKEFLDQEEAVGASVGGDDEEV